MYIRMILFYLLLSSNVSGAKAVSLVEQLALKWSYHMYAVCYSIRFHMLPHGDHFFNTVMFSVIISVHMEGVLQSLFAHCYRAPIPKQAANGCLLSRPPTPDILAQLSPQSQQTSSKGS